MAGSSKKRAVWGSDEEKKLIEIWAELLQKTNGKMVTRKKKEALATAQLNDYVSKTLEKPVIFLEKEVRNKIDSMLKKGKQIYQTKRKTGQAVDADNEIELDMEAAEGAWPNFKTFYIHFKDHPSLGPGSVEDSLSAPVADAEVDKKPSIEIAVTLTQMMMTKRKSLANHHQLRNLLHSFHQESRRAQEQMKSLSISLKRSKKKHRNPLLSMRSNCRLSRMHFRPN